MKTVIVLLAGAAIATSAVADIQDPPSNDYGPTRKLGRGLSNFFIAPAEIPVTIAKINTDEGNAAAAGYGVVRGLGRSGRTPYRWAARDSALASTGVSAELLPAPSERYSLDSRWLLGIPARTR